MTLTVIIPAYNRERFIEGCIRSLVAGGVEDTEMLVVDDGSSDNTASIVENLCAEMPFLRLIRQENRGPGGARWAVGTLKTYRGKDGYSDIIRPILPVIRKEYNRRSGTLPFHIRFRDNLRMLRALIRR